MFSQRSSFASFEIFDDPQTGAIERRIEFFAKTSFFAIVANLNPLAFPEKYYRAFEIFEKHGSQWRTLECRQEVLKYLLDRDIFPDEAKDTLRNLAIRTYKGMVDPSLFFQKLWETPFQNLRSLHLIYFGDSSSDNLTTTNILPPPNSVPQLENFTYDGLHRGAGFGTRDLISFLRSTPLLRTLRLRSKYVQICGHDPISAEGQKDEGRVEETVILTRLQALYIGYRCICGGSDSLLRSLVYPNLRGLQVMDTALSNRISNSLMAHVFHNAPYPTLEALVIEQCHQESPIDPRQLGMDIIRCAHGIKTLAFISHGPSRTWTLEAVETLCDAIRTSKQPVKLRRLYVSQKTPLTKACTKTLREAGIALNFENYHAVTF